VSPQDNVTVSIDLVLLRKQRDYLLTLPSSDELEGLINLCDYMLDAAEGFDRED